MKRDVRRPHRRRPGSSRRRRRCGFGLWVVAMIVIILALALGAGVSHQQNRGLHRSIVEGYLGRLATNIALSAAEEGYYRLHHHTLTPVLDPKAIMNWETQLISMPGPRPPSQIIEPVATRHYFMESSFAPTDYTVETISDVEMTLVDWAWNIGAGFWSGVLEFDCLVRLRIGRFPAGIAVSRRVRVRKRYYAAQASAVQSPELRYLPEDVSREIARTE